LQVFEGDAVPPQVAAEGDVFPVVGALVHEERFAGGDAVDVDAVLLKLVRKRLLDVEQASVDRGVFVAEPIKEVGDVGRIGDRCS
jgi:hypothetical protein